MGNQLLARCEDLRDEVLKLASRRLAASSPNVHSRSFKTNKCRTTEAAEEVYAATINLIASLQHKSKDQLHSNTTSSWANVRKKYGAATAIQATYRGYSTRKTHVSRLLQWKHTIAQTKSGLHSEHGPPVAAIATVTNAVINQP